jgi:uncharacterized protein
MKKEMIYRSANRIFVLLIFIYQHTLSLLLGPSCRFQPSCSSYAIQSIQRFGIFEGSWLTIKRLLKCHPFHPGGYDPIPESLQKS